MNSASHRARRRGYRERVGILLRLAAMVIGSSFATTATAALLVAAASSVRVPLDRVIETFSGDTGIEVTVSYGASGNLTHQILRGAPFSLFLSADRAFPQRLADAGLAAAGPVEYARGRLLLYVPSASHLSTVSDLDSFRRAIVDGRAGRIAIANPDLAPYGRAARQALEALGLWALVQPVLVRGNNVAQAAGFARSGDADAAFLAASMAMEPELASRGMAIELPEASYDAVIHAMVLLDSSPPARALFERIASPAARAVFARHGL